MASLDHGEMNLPLAKRYGKGGMDAALDRYNAEQRAEAKAAAKARHQRREEASAAVHALTAEHLERLAAKTGLTPRQAKQWLLSVAVSQPKLVLAAVANGEAS